MGGGYEYGGSSNNKKRARNTSAQGIFDYFSFSWMNKVVGQARKGQIPDIKELWMPEEQESEVSYGKFIANWNEELKRGKSSGRKPSLMKTLFKTFGTTFILAGIAKAMWSVFVILGAFYFIRSLLLFIDPKEKGHPYEEDFTGWVLTAFFFLDSYMLGIALQRMTFGCMVAGVSVRGTLMNAVCKKAFRMDRMKKETVADVVSFVATDITKIYSGMQEFHFLWTAPFEALAILGLLATLIYQWALPGLGVVLIVVPAQYLFGWRIAVNKYANTKNTQERGSIIQEILPAIKLVKYYVWEQFLEDQIAKVRKREMTYIYRIAVIKTINIAMVFAVPPVVAYVIFTSYEFNVKKLTAAMAFTTLSMFNIMRFPLVVLPKALRALSEALSSLSRVEEFLLRQVNTKEPLTGPIGVQMERACYSYHDADIAFKLRVPRFECKPGEVVAVVGRVGAGKSSLINAILGNMQLTEGNGNAGGRVAFVPQNPWVQNLSIRENILFGLPMEHQKYADVIHACALELDLQILAQGDESKAGLRGINLSGGQRQRVNLARAAYFDGDLVLLDNAMSAVDHHTAHHIFEHCIRGLFAKKAVVLITNQLDFLPQCDKVAIMNDGEVLYYGTWNAQAQAMLQQFLPATHLLHAAGQVEERKAAPKKDVKKQNTALSLSATGIPTTKTKAAETQVSLSHALSIYWMEMGVLLGIVVIYFFLAAQATRQMSDFWIRQWVNDTLDLYPGNAGKNEPYPKAAREYNLAYFGLVFGFVFWMLCRGAAFHWQYLGASFRLMSQMTHRVMNAPMGFFLMKPVGDLLLTFTGDQDVMDEQLVDALHYAGIYGLIILSTILLVSAQIYQFFIFLGTSIIVTLVALYFYLPTASKLKNVRADTASAAVTLVAETLEGLQVIQAFCQEEYFIAEAARRADDAHIAVFNTESLNLWLAFYCDAYGALLILFVCVFAITLKDSISGAPGATVGLAFSNTIQMLIFYTWSVRSISEVVSYMSSCERIAWLAKFTPIDGEDDVNNDDGEERRMAVVTVDDDKYTNWPRKGEVIFENVFMKYKPGANWALNGVSFRINPQEKIGVVGRTGSGKSTLLLALYRMFSLGRGRIVYDSVDISTISLQKLRRGLSIIPQEPIMFSGTVRSNLDPFNECSDAQLWQVLEQVGLQGQAKTAGGLEGKVDGTGGAAWSLGQQQLMCLARAALRKVPVLCLDEATASMDPHTETLVQGIIARLFEDRTTITIAHRLDNVISTDKIVVMEQGQLCEMEHPSVLLDNRESMFSRLVDRTGTHAAAALRALASEHLSNVQNKARNPLSQVPPAGMWGESR